MMDDKRKMEIFESVERFQKHAAMEAASRAGSYVTTTAMPDGERIVVTTVLHELDCHGIGHAILNNTDRFDAEVSTLLSYGRAYLVLGEGMVKRGIHLSKQLNKIDEVAGRAAERLLELLNSNVTDEHRQAVHLTRLEEGLRTGEVLKCDDCGEYFGIQGKPVRRVRYFKLVTKHVWVRRFMCPHCFGWTPHPLELAAALKARDEFEKSQSHTEKTGAQGGEPGPSVPNGTEGKAVTPQGDDGHASKSEMMVHGADGGKYLFLGYVEEPDGPGERYKCAECGVEVIINSTGTRVVKQPGEDYIADLQKAIYSLPPEGGVIKGTTVVKPEIPQDVDGKPDLVILFGGAYPTEAGEHVCGGTWKFDNYAVSTTANGPVYKCSKCGEYQIIFPMV